MDATEKNAVSVGKVRRATDKLGIIKEFEEFAACYQRNGGTRTDALCVFAAKYRIGKSSLERWITKYRNNRFKGLIDSRGGDQVKHEQFSPEAFGLFKNMYLTEQKLSVKLCWQNINYVNRTENHEWKIPSLRVTHNYIKRHIPHATQVLYREGVAAYEAKCAPFIQRDPDSIQPGQVWVGDHHQLNCWVRYRGKWIRPWITAWQDMRSRAMVGWCFCDSPNQTTILIAMKRAIEKYGPPESVKIDNGKDYDSETWTGTTKKRRQAVKAGYIDERMIKGLYAMLDIRVSFAIPYHPQAKPIERWFDTLDCQFVKTMKTYCGRDAARKPEYLSDMLASDRAIAEAYELDEFAEITGQYIEVFNNSAHSGDGMNGMSPARVLATRQSRRVLAEGVLDLLARIWSGELTIGKNGVRFKNMYYGQYSQELLIRQGQKVRVSYEPDDLSTVHVWDAVSWKFITIAEQNQFVAYGHAVGDEDLRHAMRQKSRALRAVREHADNQFTANTDLPMLTIRAKRSQQQQPQPQRTAQTIKPIRTPLDGQVKSVTRKETVRVLKKAAGAEHMKIDLGIDYEALKRERENPYDGVDLIDWEAIKRSKNPYKGVNLLE